MRRLLRFASLALATTATATATAAAPPGQWELLHFSLGGLYAFRRGSEVSSFVGAWTPSVSLGNGYAVRGEFGANLLKDSLGDLFIGIDTELFAVLPVVEDLLNWEIGGGAVYWSSSSGGYNPIVSTGLAVGIGHSILDRVTATYSFHFIGAGVQWFRVTLGLHWSDLE